MNEKGPRDPTRNPEPVGAKGPWEDLGLHKPAEEGQGPAWANEVDHRRPARGRGPAGINWRGPINWGLFGPKRARKGCAAVGPGAPRGGPPITAALSSGGARREAPDDGSPCVPGGRPGLVRGSLPADGASNEMAIGSRASCSHLRATWQASVGWWADVGGRRGPRGGDLTFTGMRADAGGPRDATVPLATWPQMVG